ncbi:hypothetical protein D9M71_411710 [compost metagenome]
MGVELVSGEQPAHRVAPARHLVQPQGGPGEGEDSALYLHLGEAGVAGAEVDVRRQHQLDANGVAIALHCDYQRLGQAIAAEGAPGVDGACRQRPALLEGVTDTGQVQSCGEMFAMGENQRAANVVVPLVLTEGQHQLVQHGLVESVALGCTVEADQHDMAAFFAADAACGAEGHRGFPRGNGEWAGGI